jgi:hypothetical protein
MECIIKSLHTKSTSCTGCFTGEFYQTFKKKIDVNFRKIKDGTFSTNYKVNIILTLETDKHIIRKENYMLICLISITKSFNAVLEN